MVRQGRGKCLPYIHLTGLGDCGAVRRLLSCVYSLHLGKSFFQCSRHLCDARRAHPFFPIKGNQSSSGVAREVSQMALYWDTSLLEDIKELLIIAVILIEKDYESLRQHSRVEIQVE